MDKRGIVIVVYISWLICALTIFSWWFSFIVLIAIAVCDELTESIKPCRKCNSKGYINRKCKHCGGTGRKANGKKCRTCHGDGYVSTPCPACEGRHLPLHKKIGRILRKP